MLTAALLSLAVSLDPMKDSSPRERVPDAFVSKFGIQIHKACFDYAASGDTGYMPTPREYAEERFETLIAKATEKVVVECRASYPELDPYLVEWISSMRRAILTCTKKNSGEADFRAVSLLNGHSLDNELTASEQAGIKRFGLFNNGNYPKNHRPVIVYPRDTLIELLRVGSEHNTRTLDTFIHEILHATGANNRDDHNEVEVVVPDEKDRKKFCSDDISVDRVNVVAGLCSGDTLGKENVAAYLFKRISWCGFNKCTQLFMTEEPESWTDTLANRGSPTRALGAREADRLCRRLYVEGGCRYIRETQKEAVTQKNHAMITLAGQLRARFSELIPFSPAQLPRELLALGTNLAERLKSSTTPACFGAIFEERADGALLLKRRPLAVASHYEPADRLRAIIIAAAAQLDGEVPECVGYAAQGNFRWMLWQAHAELDGMFSVDEYKQLMRPRLEGKAETYYKPVFPGGTRAELLKKAVGPALFDEYLVAVRKHHFDSPEFDCANVIGSKAIK